MENYRLVSLIPKMFEIFERSIFMSRRFAVFFTGLFLYPLKTSENLIFSMFSGGAERDQWYETGV